MSDWFALTFAIAIAAMLLWSGLRAWRAESTVRRWVGAGLAAIAFAAVAGIGVVMAIGLWKLHARSAPPVTLSVTRAPAQIQRGREISDGFCSGCHSTNGTLTGGLDLAVNFPIRFGSFVASNLTPAGALSRWSDGDIFRAIRNGVDPEGRWLVIMSYTNAGKLSDEDTAAVIAYLRSLPAAGSRTPEPADRLNVLGLAMLGAGLLPTGKPVATGAVTAPAKAPHARFGEYILSYQDCRECHGRRLTGGTPGQLPPLGPDLRLVKSWKFDEFVKTFRTGIDPNGHAISKDMPWEPIGRMDDDELRAIYSYLLQLPDD
ncbi:c-type cytochrome [Bradyrhizobium liaoningense]|uniref:cytochrome c n=1 Tax=Bradyrhizobium liaoningense TaxID=43992 RepID=UPI001BAE1573|nr:c-type cytochrome [Bradyrhizobium liaoningense]MBR0740678.1 c-type cytochrome [Bradyrhizobium liaoningense]